MPDPASLRYGAGNISLICGLAYSTLSTSSPPCHRHVTNLGTLPAHAFAREISIAQWLEYLAVFPEAIRNLCCNMYHPGIFAWGTQRRVYSMEQRACRQSTFSVPHHGRLADSFWSIGRRGAMVVGRVSVGGRPHSAALLPRGVLLASSLVLDPVCRDAHIPGQLI